MTDGIQAIGQEAKSEQGAAAFSLGLQHGASNDNAPVRVDSKGDGGSVDQSNSVDSTATAANLNALKQDADQEQSGSGGTQAIGQEAKNEQAAIGLSAALQHGASNSNTPVRVDSKGDGGDVSQSNSVDSDATALNVNLTKQDADQYQGGRSKECGCMTGPASRRSARRRRVSRARWPRRWPRRQGRATRTLRSAWTARATAGPSTSRTASTPMPRLPT